MISYVNVILITKFKPKVNIYYKYRKFVTVK